MKILTLDTDANLRNNNIKQILSLKEMILLKYKEGQGYKKRNRNA